MTINHPLILSSADVLLQYLCRVGRVGEGVSDRLRLQPVHCPVDWLRALVTPDLPALPDQTLLDLD